MNSIPELAPIFLRAHTRVKNEKPQRSNEWPRHVKWANFALVLDCETTCDIRQTLTFLWWRFCELKNGVYVCQQEGVVYADDLDLAAVKLIRKYARSLRADVEDGCPPNIMVQSRTEFVDGIFWEALRSGAVVVGFNTPFDLSRLALEYREAQKKNSGWSMVFWKFDGKPDKFKPKLRIKPKDSRAAFIELAGGDPNNRAVYRGRFLDLSVLGAAMRSRHLTLDGFLESFGLAGKLQHEPTGKVTMRELEYGRHDVDRTVALLNAMKREYDGFSLELAPERAMSAASITKAFLDQMALNPPAEKFNISDEVLGKCMQAYYGGRSEIRLRHQELPIVICDTTSEYPTVAINLNLWSVLTAANVEVIDCTAEAQSILDLLTLDTALERTEWQSFAFFASVKPTADILPVRSMYGESGNTNIGLNPLTSAEPIWYAGPDLIGSKLKTGRAPEIIQAFKLVPKGKQKGMKMIAIGSRAIDPAKDDFFRAVIEERKMLPKDHPHNLLLKIIANSLYGIFAELNKYEFGKNSAKMIKVFSGEHKFEQPASIIERPGRWHFPPAAALITACGRLMLTIMECLAEKYDGTHLLTDTDSMFFIATEAGGLIPCPGETHAMPDGTPAVHTITWKQVQEICETLNRLNPYDKSVVKQILKIEDSNYDRSGKQHQLYGVAVSAKRYIIYKRHKRKLQIIKPSEHGLGFLYVPDRRKRHIPGDCKDQDSSYPRWVVEAWERMLADHFRMLNNPEDASARSELWFEDLPAMMRVRITTPTVMKALRKRDPEAAKPYNFALSPNLIERRPNCALIGQFSKQPANWETQEYTEIYSGKTVRLHKNFAGKKLIPQTIRGVLWKHFLHPENKSLAADGQLCNPHTRGLLIRRPIRAMIPFQFMGKEIERKAQEGEDISVVENSGPITYQARRTRNTHAAEPGLILRAKRFPLRQLARESGVSPHAVERFLRGERVFPKTRARIAAALPRLERCSGAGKKLPKIR
jgi:hypothetical protein